MGINCAPLLADLFLYSYEADGQPSRGGDRKIFEMMTSTLPEGTLGSVASLLTTTLHQENPDRNHKLWNIVSSERDILHCPPSIYM
jgi:hypothetical protein